MTSLDYRDVDYDSPADRALLARWYEDPATKHLYSLFTDEESAAQAFTPDYFLRVGRSLPTTGPFRSLLVLADGVPIGEAKFETDTPKLLTREPHTAWIALIIGEESYRGRGLAVEIVRHLEGLASASGALRIEIGIFAYNTRSLRLFTQLGYEEFARQPERIWWDGRRWDDVRLLKTL